MRKARHLGTLTKRRKKARLVKSNSVERKLLDWQRIDVQYTADNGNEACDATYLLEEKMMPMKNIRNLLRISPCFNNFIIYKAYLSY